MLTDVTASIGNDGMPEQSVKAKVLYNGGTTSAGTNNNYMVNSASEKIPEEFQVEIKNSSNGRIAAIWS
jgi:hypothetical protein